MTDDYERGNNLVPLMRFALNWLGIKAGRSGPGSGWQSGHMNLNLGGD